MPDAGDRDSPLSIVASIAGILTLCAAIAATLYVRFTYLRNADVEYFRVKASLFWFKTESTFMVDLIESQLGRSREKEMFGFVVDDLKRLEVRLLEVVEEAEKGVSVDEVKKEGWTVVPRGLRGKTDIAMNWLPIRAKALELVRQRDALGSRVLFAQMSLISSRVKDQETKAKKREERQQDRLDRLQRKIDRLEDLVYRLMHRGNVSLHSGDISLHRQESELSHYEGLDSSTEDIREPTASYPADKPPMADMRAFPSS